MGLPPKGEIIARPMMPRACGCIQEFQYYAVDKYRAQRLAKFQQSRCPACVAKLVEEQRKAAPLPKGEALKQLPPGAAGVADPPARRGLVRQIGRGREDG